MAYTAYRTWAVGAVLTAAQLNTDLRDNGLWIYDRAVRRTIVQKGGAYTLTDIDDIILGNAGAGAFTLTLPTAVGFSGRAYDIKKIDSSGNVVTVATTGGETIDGAATLAIVGQNDSYTIVSDGTNWRII